MAAKDTIPIWFSIYMFSIPTRVLHRVEERERESVILLGGSDAENWGRGRLHRSEDFAEEPLNCEVAENFASISSCSAVARRLSSRSIDRTEKYRRARSTHVVTKSTNDMTNILRSSGSLVSGVDVLSADSTYGDHSGYEIGRAKHSAQARSKAEPDTNRTSA